MSLLSMLKGSYKIHFIFLGCCIVVSNVYAMDISHRYDEVGRLALVDYGGGNTQVYTYDSAGNIVEVKSTTNVTTDTTPDAFSFAAQTNVARSTPLTSAPVAITGINAATNWSVTNGTACVGSSAANCGCADSAFTSSGTISNNQSICARHTTSANYATKMTTTVTVGGVGGKFESTTLTEGVNPPPTTPKPSMSIQFDKASLDALGATYAGATQVTQGYDGAENAIKFYGVDNPGHVRIPNQENIQFTDAATFDTWVRIDSTRGKNGYGNTVDTGAVMAVLAKSHDRSGVAMPITPIPTGGAWFATFDNSWRDANCQVVKNDFNIPINTWFRAFPYTQVPS